MRKLFFSFIEATLITLIAGLCFVGCKSGEVGLSTPSDFYAYQEGSTIVLTWNEVVGASFYEITKNGQYWQSTSKTQIVDRNPVEGINSYELIASDGEEQSKPAKTSYDFEYANPGGGEETGASFYIKHPWGDGSNSSWSWEPMTKKGNSYICSGLWGGVGANINTIADDSGAEWYDESYISGAASLSIGDYVTFTFTPTNGLKGTLSVSSNGGGGQGGDDDEQTGASFYIKHPWGDGADASWAWKPMTKSGNSYTCSGLWGGVGANINTSASDSGSKWYSATEISGANSLSKGDNVTFTFVSSSGVNGTLSVSSNGGNNQGGNGDDGGNDDGGEETVTKPSTPTGVKATAGSSSITVTWNAVSGADNYNVYRSISYNGNYNFVSMAYSTTYTDNDVTAGTRYYYKITAENSAGESAKSSYASALVSSGGGGGTTTVPSAPTGVKATAGSSMIAVSWNTVSGATKYRVYRSTSAYGSYDQVSTENYTTYNDYNATAGTTYYYKVTAVNSSGGESEKSDYASAKISSSGGGGGTSSKPSAPTGVGCTSSKYFGSFYCVQVSWYPVSGATEYTVWRSTTAYGDYIYMGTSSTNSYDDCGLTAGTTVYYKVTASNSSGQQSDFSSYASITIKAE